jgi:hypothetical protein
MIRLWRLATQMVATGTAPAATPTRTTDEDALVDMRRVMDLWDRDVWERDGFLVPQCTAGAPRMDHVRAWLI